MKNFILGVCLLGSILTLHSLHSQITFTQWDFNNITAGNISTATPSTGSGSVALLGGVTTPTTGSAGLGSSDLAASNLALQTTTYPAQSQLNQTAGFQFNANTTGYQSIKLKFDMRCSNTASRWVRIQYTLNGSTWINLGAPYRIGGMADNTVGDIWVNQNVFDFSSISGANNNVNFGVRILSCFSANAFTLHNTSSMYIANEAYEPANNPSTGANSNYGTSGTLRLDMVSFEGTTLAPTVSSNLTSLQPFSQLLGTPSNVQSFSVSGSSLTGNLSLNAPSGYQISLSSGSGFQSSLSLTPSSGIVSNTTIYARLNAGTAGPYAGNIVLSASGAVNVNVAVTGICSPLPLPTISTDPITISGFQQTLGTPSTEEILTVSGENLTDNITVAAPLGYQVSLMSGTGFTNSVVLNQTGGVVNSELVYVRLNHTVIGPLVSNLTLSSAGATNALVALSGSVQAPPPPFLSVTPLTLSSFLQNLGFPSANQNVSVAGDNLLGDVTITSNSNFYISTSSSGPFSQLLALTPVSGYLDPVQVFVHLNANSAGTSNGILTISTQGATPVEVNLAGSSVQPQGSLLYYWHFNNLDTPVDVTTIDADYSLLPGVTGKFDYTNPVTGQRDMDAYDTGSLLNSQMGEAAGKGCRVRNPSTNRTLDFFVPTNNASGIKFAYTVHRSGLGMQENIISYSINGTDYITTGLSNNSITVTETYELYSVDFTSIPGANNNPNFRIRITFNGSTDPISGNNRFDNFTLTANTYMGLEDNNLPLVVVYPNPATDIVQVACEVPVNRISVIDLNGRVVLTSTESTFSIESLFSGMYILIVETAQGTAQKNMVKF